MVGIIDLISLGLDINDEVRRERERGKKSQLKKATEKEMEELIKQTIEKTIHRTITAQEEAKVMAEIRRKEDVEAMQLAQSPNVIYLRNALENRAYENALHLARTPEGSKFLKYAARKKDWWYFPPAFVEWLAHTSMTKKEPHQPIEFEEVLSEISSNAPHLLASTIPNLSKSLSAVDQERQGFGLHLLEMYSQKHDLPKNTMPDIVNILPIYRADPEYKPTSNAIEIIKRWMTRTRNPTKQEINAMEELEVITWGLDRELLEELREETLTVNRSHQLPEKYKRACGRMYNKIRGTYKLKEPLEFKRYYVWRLKNKKPKKRAETAKRLALYLAGRNPLPEKHFRAILPHVIANLTHQDPEVVKQNTRLVQELTRKGHITRELAIPILDALGRGNAMHKNKEIAVRAKDVFNQCTERGYIRPLGRQVRREGRIV